MTEAGYNSRNSRKAGFTAWLALAAVLLLQVGAATHEAQHSAGDIGDVCEICVQLESGASLDTGTAGTPTLAATAIRNIDWHDALVAAAPYRTPQLRAPPALI